MTLIDAVRLLWEGRRPLLVLPLLAALLALGLTADQPRSWKASVSVQLDLAPSSDPQMPGAPRPDRFVLGSQLANATTVLQSDALLGRSAAAALEAALAARAEGRSARVGEVEVGDPLPALALGWDGDAASVPGDAEATAALRSWALGRDGPLSPERVGAALAVKRPSEGDIVVLELALEDRALALVLLDAIVGEFAAYRAQEREGAASSARRFFEGRVAEAREALTASEDALQAFRRGADISNYDEQTRSLSLQIKDVGFVLERERAAAASASATAEGVRALLDGQEGLLERARSLVVEQEVLALQGQLAADRAARAIERALRGDLGAESGAPADLDAALGRLYQRRLTGLGAHQAELVERWVSARLEAEAGATTVRTLEAYAARLVEENQRYAALGSQVARLEREAGTAEQEYLELLHSLNLARLYEQQTSGARPLVVIDPVAAPADPESSRRGLVVAVAGLSAFVLVAILLLVAAYVDVGLYLPSEVQAQLGAPVWGALPTLRDAERRPDEADLAGRTPSGRLIVEAAQALERRLGEGGRLLVVAARPGAGTSTVARWLAVALEARGRSVAIVRPGDVVSGAALVDTPDTSASAVAFDRPCGADGALLVFDVGRPVVEADRRMIDALARAGAPVVGVVMNRAGYEAAESLLGHVPRPRSRMRVWAKRVLSGTLSSRRPWIA